MEVEQPVWVLDRRDSGHLFWRRSHSLVDKRVKFRCDVEVLEFCRSDEEKQQMLGINRGNSCRMNEEMPPPSSLAAAFCICIILATISYNWLIASSI
ncbi:hypothetical protein O3M35_008662 [Rhynocoris fuscipes]|uniref:Uncharacterized protein n=1 Tax=Rhynocoris fuscipes TaxID=488301 RepID=A0AAW1DEF7_9HEMI